MAPKSVFLLFPHQLFRQVDALQEVDEVYLIEEYLFFNQYAFHQQKLLLHRSSMKFYANYLTTKNFKLKYIEAIHQLHDVQKLITHLAEQGVQTIYYYDVCDNWLEKRIHQTCAKHSIQHHELPSPLFINSKEELKEYFSGRKQYFQTDFYKQQRKKHGILLDKSGKPLGGKWSFDAENRLKYPKDKAVPKVQFPAVNPFYIEAKSYVAQHYSTNYGCIDEQVRYPCTFDESEEWLQQFLQHRLHEFGAYEDAIVEHESYLHHSVLTPLLNIGLLLPMQIVNAAIDYAEKHQVALNSLEGFIRQIIGWREFIRGVYVYQGTNERNKNFWQFKKEIPQAFYSGTTGILPVDAVIKKLNRTAYNHHIERLMVLGNIMLLSEFHPNCVYQWFMEMYIDAYDWVMVPNVYGMSQFADGGTMATKPYFSGSSYILKMSNFKKGNWCPLWDALFWHFMDKHREFFSSNPRLGMLLKTYDKMSLEKKAEIKHWYEWYQKSPGS